MKIHYLSDADIAEGLAEMETKYPGKNLDDLLEEDDADQNLDLIHWDFLRRAQERRKKKT